MNEEQSSRDSFQDPPANLNETETINLEQNVDRSRLPVYELDEFANELPSTSSKCNSTARSAFTLIGSPSKKIKEATNKLIFSNEERILIRQMSIGSEESTNDSPASASVSPIVSSSQTQSSFGDPILREGTESWDEPEGQSPADDSLYDVLGNGQLVKKVITKATIQMRPKPGDLVTINYIRQLRNGTIVEEARELQFHLGDCEIVQGLDMAIPLMDLNEVARIEMDACLAYGSIGLRNEECSEKSILPWQSLIYTVELKNIKEGLLDFQSFDLRRNYCKCKKERGNFWFRRGEYNAAIQLYERALDYLEHNDELSNTELQTLLDERLIIYNNIAMAQIKLSAFDDALKSVETVLRSQPNNSKALYRKGRILECKGDIAGAQILIQKAATIERESKEIQQKREKELCQKMLGADKTAPKEKITENSKLRILSYAVGTILICTAGLAMFRKMH